MGLPSSRYFMWAERLVYREGAVRGALLAEMRRGPAPVVSAPVSETRPVDPRALEELTNQNGFAGFEYAGGN